MKKESYDIVFFCQVLEHFLLSPEFAIRTVMSLVRKGGLIFFAVPNFAKIQNRVLLMRGGNPQEQLAAQVPYYAHIREPVCKEAEKWWTDAGGTIIRKGFTNYNQEEPGGFLSRLFWTARFVKIANWFGICQVWFSHTREYFYFLIRK
jgi:2-polyprenyl-3-methyl-5-hydroxy-6-metoxy-1,4-benzoquinol methylase